jgi:hypothetical protein
LIPVKPDAFYRRIEGIRLFSAVPYERLYFAGISGYWRKPTMKNT